MGEWQLVDTEELNRPRHRSEGGVEFTVYLSPHDVPTAVRGGYDKDLQRFVVELRYLDEEPLRTEEVDDDVSLWIGRHSQRLNRIEIDIEKLKARSVQLKLVVPELIDKALKQLEDEQAGSRGSYEALREVFTKSQERLLSELSPT